MNHLYCVSDDELAAKRAALSPADRATLDALPAPAAVEYADLSRNLGWACGDCMLAVANGTCSDLDESQAQQTRTGLDRIAASLGVVYLFVGDDCGYHRATCCVCLRFEGGDKFEVRYLVPRGLPKT